MKPNKLLEQLKGLHPGPFLERELKKRGIVQGKFALKIGEYPQTLNSILKGKRKMNVALSLKIEKELELPEGFLMTLQVYHEIREERLANQRKPDLSKFSRSLFWDTDINTIDWERYKRAVIERVFKIGDEEEKQEIEKYYGTDEIAKVLNETK